MLTSRRWRPFSQVRGSDGSAQVTDGARLAGQRLVQGVGRSVPGSIAAAAGLSFSDCSAGATGSGTETRAGLGRVVGWLGYYQE